MVPERGWHGGLSKHSSNNIVNCFYFAFGVTVLGWCVRAGIITLIIKGRTTTNDTQTITKGRTTTNDTQTIIKGRTNNKETL